MDFAADTFREFSRHVIIPSRDAGLIAMSPLFGTQEYLLSEITRALRDGVRHLVVLKGGRQVGGSSLCDALTLYWLQTHAGMVGQMVSDDLANMKYRRKLLRAMLRSLPKGYRFPVNADNLDYLEWASPNGSTLVFDYAGLRGDTNLGRSKGLNYLYADEVGSWPDQSAVGALEASLSERHPHRLYVWISTARGLGSVWHNMWKGAHRAVTQRAVFVPWYRHHGYRIARAERALWSAYGEPERTSEERLWIHVVKRRYGLEIEQEQLAWHRWMLIEKMRGDEALMEQEFGCLPESCFQAFGDKFISPRTIRVLRLGLDTQRSPDGYEYIWAASLDETGCVAVDANSESAMVPEETSGRLERVLPPAQDETAHSESSDLMEQEGSDPDAPLLIWEEPKPEGVYIVAAHPWGSSHPDATMFVCQVWRCWPDKLVQCAEYASAEGLMYQFAWVCLHLAGAYRGKPGGAYFILEQAATGLQVQREIEFISERRYGLSAQAKDDLRDVLGSVQHYLFTRPGSFRPNPLMQWQTSPAFRPMLIYAMQDEVERGHVDVRSRALIDELALLRRGERGDNDQVEGGGQKSAARAMTLAMATEYWRKSVMVDLPYFVGDRTPTPEPPKEVREVLVGRFLQEVLGR